MSGTSTSKIERYVWAKRPASPELLIHHPALSRAGDGKSFHSIKDAAEWDMNASPLVRNQGDHLFRVTVTEVEVPQMCWWSVYQWDNSPIEVEKTCADGDHVQVSGDVTHIYRRARVQAYDRDGAIAEARRAWADLAANLAGGAE